MAKHKKKQTGDSSGTRRGGRDRRRDAGAGSGGGRPPPDAAPVGLLPLQALIFIILAVLLRLTGVQAVVLLVYVLVQNAVFAPRQLRPRAVQEDEDSGTLTAEATPSQGVMGHLFATFRVGSGSSNTNIVKCANCGHTFPSKIHAVCPRCRN